MAYGNYDAATTREVFRFTRPRLTLPVSSADGGLADSVYEYVGRSDTEGYHVYRLTGLFEWMPPLHPSMRGRADRVQRVNETGGVDLEAEAALRRREWADMTMLNDNPVYEEKD